MTTKTQTTAIALPVVQDGLQTYLQRVHEIPLLTPEQEFELAKRLHDEGDMEAAQQLVISNLRFVVSIARGYMGYGLQMADLVQEGTVGLMKAVKRFDPNVGVRLVGFAVHWIKSEIHEFVIRNWRIVKVATTKPQRKLFFNLRGHKKKLAWFTKEEAESVAKDLGVPLKDVLEMESRLHAHDAVFDAPVNDDEDSYTYSPQQYLTADDANSIGDDPLQVLSVGNLAAVQQEKLASALKQLDARSLDIISSRYLVDKKVGLKVLAEKYDVSLERIRQIEKVAINSLKDAVSE